jgi:hypothetical protein
LNSDVLPTCGRPMIPVFMIVSSYRSRGQPAENLLV